MTLDRILRLLASYNIVACATEKEDDSEKVTLRYGPAPVCKWLTKNEEGVSMASLVLLNQDKLPMESWYFISFFININILAFLRANSLTVYPVLFF
jgi:hypothetical protein